MMESVRKIYTVGESLVDIIFRNGKEVNRVAGGSVVNSSISLGRLGQKVNLVSEVGADKKGDFLLNFMEKNQVNTKYVIKYKNGKTAFSHAFLNEKNEATYKFFKWLPEHREIPDNIEFNSGDIVLFGSWFAIDPGIHAQVTKLITRAKEQGAMVIYDPNFRKAHLKDLEKLKPLILKNMSNADIIRGSDEDFLNILNTPMAQNTYEKLHELCQVMIYTSGGKGVMLYTPTQNLHFSVPALKPVSTIGAGDTFNAGIIYALLQNQIQRQDLTQLKGPQWSRLVDPAIKMSAEVCMSMENYIPANY